MYPRARRMAVIVASVPVDTMRSFSIGPSPSTCTRCLTSSASSVSPGVDAPNDSPRDAACCTASTVPGCACPRIAGPHDATRSTYSRPSASVT